MTSLPQASAAVDLERLLVAMRPKLHRYCARMVGSVIDGEDVLQDALTKAVEAFASAGAIGNPEGWLFRIAHNTALDFLRRRNRQAAIFSEAELDMIADELDAVTSRQIATASLRTFMRLPETQRACVILSRCAWLFLKRSLRCHGFQSGRSKSLAASWARKTSRTGGGAGGCAAACPVRDGTEPACRLCRTFQRPRFRRHPRHDRRRRQARTRQQDTHARQGRGQQVFWQLFRRRRLASGAGPCRGTSSHPGVRSRRCRADRRNISCCWVGRATRSPPSGIFATRPISSTAPNIASDLLRRLA